jgi:hypothetical protein
VRDPPGTQDLTVNAGDATDPGRTYRRWRWQSPKSTTGDGDMFYTNYLPMSASRSHTEALEAWREAAELVRVRWRAFVAAGAASRSQAFAVYVAALDAEEAAAHRQRHQPR